MSQNPAANTSGAPDRPRDRLPLILWLLYVVVLVALSIVMAVLPVPLWRLLVPQSTPQITRAVPKTDLAAYHLITASDLIDTRLPTAQLPTDTITSTSSLSGSISLMPLTAGQPITTDQVLSIADPMVISGTLVTAIEGGPALAFGGQLRTGTVVTAWVDDRRIADHLLVLYVKRFDAQGTSGPIERYVIILAVPSDRRTEIMRAAAGGTLSFSLAP